MTITRQHPVTIVSGGGDTVRQVLDKYDEEFTDLITSANTNIAAATPTDIETKTAYENNANTNAYTDLEKSKLATIDDRANHTGTQTAATISDFDTEVANNSAVTANTAKISVTSEISNIIEDITPQLGGDLDCNGNTIDKSSYAQIADASLATGTHTFDFSAGDMQQLTATGDITIAFSNFVTGKVCTMIIDAVNWGDYTITHPAGLLFAEATAPTYTSGGTDRLIVIKDKDDIYSLFIVGQGVA